MTLRGRSVFNNPNDFRPFDVLIAPEGTTIYVVDAGLAKVRAWVT